jgi:hypothetical protein
VVLRVDVSDTGIGIAPEVQQRLFTAFSQGDTSTTRQYGGTGLGLAISKQIVETMGGTMFVDTVEGEGSTFGFRVTLPKESAPTDEKQPPSRLRILVAEENAASREALCLLFSDRNTASAAASGAEAHGLLQQAAASGGGFDLILMDQRLLDDFQRARQAAPLDGPRTPLILLVPVHRLASTPVPDWPAPTAFLARPVKREECLWCVAELLGGAVAGAPLPTRPKEGEETRPLHGLRVLVAEDNPVNHRIICRFLERMGVTWDLAENGEEAVRHARERRFDLILMDLQMPVMDGLEATLAIREHEATRGGHVPIIAVTAAVLDEDRRSCLTAGFDDHLPKPMKFADLEQKVRSWTGPRASKVG